ncbi:MAG: hypothetical protein R3Y56_07510 [Akkermansia sp.]
MGCKRHAALGLAVDWFSWLDSQTEDGITFLLPEEMDDELGWKGAFTAFERIGWVSLDEQGGVIANGFDEHNGASAKNRAETAKRVARCKANKKGVIRVTEEVTQIPLPDALPREEKNIYKNTESSNTTVNRENSEFPNHAELAPPSWHNDAFAEWCGKLCAGHPAAARYQVLPKPVEQAARQAFSLVQVSEEDCKMLKAYYKAEIPESRGVDKYYRPASLEKFFADLGDVLSHATNWAKWSGWSRKRKAKAKPVHPLPAAQEDNASIEEKDALIAAMKKDVGL